MMDITEKHYIKMTKTPVSKLIILLGIPTTISMLVTSIYNMADTYFVGMLGESEQAATGILFSLQCIIQAFAFMFGHGSGVFVARALAQKNKDESSKFISSAFFIGAIFGILFMMIGLIFIEPLMKLLGSSDTALPFAKDYGLWVLLACPFMICSIILNNNLRYEGKAIFSMVGLVSGALLNIFGDWLFICVMNLGVFGAGMSTAISQFISFIILLVLYFKMAQSRISFKKISRQIIVYWNIIKVGLPSLIRQGLTAISNGLLNNLAKPFGDAAVAALSVINRFTNFVLCVGLGMGQGFQPVASFNYQAKQYTRVKKGLIFTISFSAVIVLMFSFFGIAFPKTIVWIFQKSPDVIEIGKFGLRIASIAVLFLPISVSANMLFQSIGRVGIASLLSLLRSGLIFIPTLLICSNLFDLNGILLSQPIADVLSGIISIPFILYFIFRTPNTKEVPEYLEKSNI